MKVLVLVADRLPLGFVGCYGSDWVDTPALDRLAAEGIAFDQHYADRPDPAGARRAWRTGRYHLPSPDGAEPSPAEEPDLLQCLRAGGVATYLVGGVEAGEFARGWEHRSHVTDSGDGDPLEQRLGAVERALEQLAAAESWFLWVELAPLIPPWKVPQEFIEHYFPPSAGEEGTEPRTPFAALSVGCWEGDDAGLTRLQDSYAAAVSYLDAGIDALTEHLRGRKLLDELILVVTTDCGLALGEHGIVGDCRPWLHDELIHLPLLIRLPGAAESGRRVHALTQPVDLMPTLLYAFGLPAAPVHGLSLLPLLRGSDAAIRPYACAGHKLGPAAEWCLRTPEWSFLLPLGEKSGEPARGAQLYSKPDDRWEMNNVIQHHLELADRLELTLRGFVKATRQPGTLRAPGLDVVESSGGTP